jgi:hypothetical protein
MAIPLKFFTTKNKPRMEMFKGDYPIDRGFSNQLERQKT